MSDAAASPPAIPMIRAPAGADGRHRVFAPGGYEWWRFQARSHDGRTMLVADFFEGEPFAEDYLRHYARFVRRPTKVLPPLPRDYRGASLWIEREGERAQRFHHSCRADSEEGDDAVHDPRGFKLPIGHSRLHYRGSFRLKLHDPRERLWAKLEFLPASWGKEADYTFPSRSHTGADHHWSIPAPLMKAAGRIEAGGESFDFAGQAALDHRWGSGPLIAAGRRWMHGRILAESVSIGFAAAWPGTSETGEAIVVQRDVEGAITTTGVAAAGWRGYPRELAVPLPQWHEDHLHLANPRVLDRSAGRVRLLYHAAFPGGTGPAYCEVAG